MRVGLALGAVLLLAGCDQIGGPSAPHTADADSDASALASAAGAFDYRYAYRLPGNRVKPVQQSNADACDRLGPARCSIIGMKYRVDQGNRISAALTLQLDPLIARSFGDAVGKAVASADGVLVDTQVTGSAAAAGARGDALMARLREQLANARAAANATGDAAATAKARAERYQQALDTIAEVEAGQGQSLATVPVLITYRSSSNLAGLGGSPEANFRNAGQTLLVSLAGMADVLAGIGPWIILLLGGALLLRWLLNRTAERGAAHAPRHDEIPAEPEPHHDRNLIQRWFARDEADTHAPEHQ